MQSVDQSLCLCNNYVYLRYGTSFVGIHRRPLSPMRGHITAAVLYASRALLLGNLLESVDVALSGP